MTAPTIQLSDYKPYPFLINNVHMQFKLAANTTQVTTKIAFRPNPANPGGPLFLDGQQLKLISAKIDGVELEDAAFSQNETGLTVEEAALPKGPFTWECTVEIDPANNTSLDGLYMTNGLYCTQCEAQGFRKITFYPDRPDVMTTFTVRIDSDLPVLLSNGNPTDSGKGWVEWHDPWPKPAYLFALVAGELISHDDKFTTKSGRHVDLKIYVRPGDEGKCAYAMDSLIRSMKWDEDEYGREYDLDLFNIVAVDDFNMGAMENKGLNVFNSSLVLASPETATDMNYERIESVIAHEYFHNWTGNRITCRDWFQLCLKEGLTVFRDQHFTSDMRDPTVKRIADVQGLRGRQYSEDAGPLSHPPRPNKYIEINNFYTATVYEKGAEVVGMLRRLVGPEMYRKALDLYFDRHDGQACTIEDWITVFQDATGRDLEQFTLWYTSAGTPKVSVSETWENGVFSLTMTQKTPATPDEETKAPRHIPIAVGLLNSDGSEAVATQVLELTETTQTFTFDGLSERPIASVLRGFSAPINLDYNSNDSFLLAHDTDPFNKWEAARNIGLGILLGLSNGENAIDAGFLQAMQKLAVDNGLDPAFRALTLTLPSEDVIAAEIAAEGGTPDPLAIHAARKTLNKAIAAQMASDLAMLYNSQKVDGPYSPAAKDAGKRALRGRMLALLTSLDPDATLAKQQFADADNMTEKFGALALLVGAGQAETALTDFYDQWHHEKLVLDKWFSVQAMGTPPENAVETVRTLTQHADFDWKNPNRFRSLIGVFAGANPAGFHEDGGAGYELFADWLIKLDPVNPQIAARMSTALESWRRYGPDRQTQMKAALQRVLDTPNLSKNTSEIVSRILG
ncbi:MAG: aminopeptidase N [Rhodobacteraceae bacterium]|nr:aminopeptidase N [Paracoccaceae bacterium]